MGNLQSGPGRVSSRLNYGKYKDTYADHNDEESSSRADQGNYMMEGDDGIDKLAENCEDDFEEDGDDNQDEDGEEEGDFDESRNEHDDDHLQNQNLEESSLPEESGEHE